MDITALVGRFIGPDGKINFPDVLTLPGLAEELFNVESQAGTLNRVVLHDWDFTGEKPAAVEYTRGGVNTRIKAVAARLQQTCTRGDRVAILMGNSAHYLFGFTGAMYAGCVPVPLYDPNEPAHEAHLSAVLGDCAPTAVLTDGRSAAAVRRRFADIPAADRPRIIAVDALPDSLAKEWLHPMATEEGKAALAQALAAGYKPVESTAFLQYTSGSTRTPAGVVLTHRSIMANALQIYLSAKVKQPARFVSWLPLHHDLGIVLTVVFTALGFGVDLFSPRDFLQQPSRWLKLMNPRGDDDNIYTVVPNFALELAVRYGTPADGEELDLSQVAGVFVGSEPVTPRALQRFQDTFGPYGLTDGALMPGYGLAEATLLVSLPQPYRSGLSYPLLTHVTRDSLMTGVVEVVEEPGENTSTLTACGETGQPDQFLTIVDPDTRHELPEGHVGEIWVHGDNIAAGYLDRPSETAETFRNTLLKKLDSHSQVADAPDDDRWLATGDLGLLINGQLYITGRKKDLIIIAGRNHYPQDIEYTVDHASDLIRPSAVAAFAVTGDSDTGEELVIFAERDFGVDNSKDSDIVAAVSAAVTAGHGVKPADIVLMDPDSIPRSSAGKIARRVCARKYMNS